MGLKRIVKEWWVRPLDRLRAMEPDLRHMAEMFAVLLDDCAVQEKSAPFLLVKFFHEVSRLHDKMSEFYAMIQAFESVNDGRYDALIRDLHAMSVHIQAAGRNRYQMNRTEKGETVTPENVFLGGIFGIWTFSVAYWMEHQESDAFPVIVEQAKCFMEFHVFFMIKTTTKLLVMTDTGRYE
ncbi:MAG: hypothetical protein KGI50_01230 [Patescibacteria group bacterium]|nr:hypothetical protein [Patescibacteria group bacterium]MDE2438028.1 hypothetical protein [Patescibacteria group bacterium]